MPTTVTLDRDVLQLLQEEMHRTQSSLKQSVNAVVRRALAPSATKTQKRFVARSFAMGLRPGIDETRLGQLADQLEDEELIRRMRRAEAAERMRQARERGNKRRSG